MNTKKHLGNSLSMMALMAFACMAIVSIMVMQAGIL
jgi:hypothetical protein